jgi:phosphinothricin acetyltransferase
MSRRKESKVIRNVQETDSIAIARIYNHYIAHSTCTFEEHPVTDADMAERIRVVVDSDLPWLVFEHQGQVVGYCYAKRWNARSAYRFTVESSVYVDNETPTKGVGSRLYDALFNDLQARGVKNIMSVITLPNDASVKFHDKMGMQQVGHFKQIGFKFEQWLDVGYWQKVLD